MSAVRGWPVTLRRGDVRLRPLRVSDVGAWEALQLRNRDWLGPWEATSPDGSLAPSFPAVVRAFRREARAGRMIPLVVEVDGRFRGQVSVTQIAWGSARSGAIGYWIDREVAGQGIIPLAVAMVVDHCFETVGLHRLEVNVRPENAASLAVARKLGLREEGVRRAFIHIDGAWRDHVSFAVTAEEVLPEGLVARLLAAGGQVTIATTPDTPGAGAGGAPGGRPTVPG
ncbi:MAG: GNAT family N-acetyltransferase [Kineosporiaceae bacterium]